MDMAWARSSKTRLWVLESLMVEAKAVVRDCSGAMELANSSVPTLQRVFWSACLVNFLTSSRSSRIVLCGLSCCSSSLNPSLVHPQSCENATIKLSGSAMQIFVLPI